MNSRARPFGRVVSLRVAMMLIISCASFAATPEDEKSAQQLGIKVEVVQQIRRSEGLTNQALQRLPADKLSALLWRMNHPDMPRERAKFALLQEADENGTIPAGALRSAVQQLRQGRKTVVKSTVAGLPTGPQVNPAFLLFRGGLEQGRWQSLGPDHIGGRTRSLVFDAANSAHFWVGSVSGGIWQTTDGGQHFSPVDDFMANLAVTSIVIDPTNPKMLYAATGEGVDGVSRGSGIFVTDGGPWKQLPGTDTVDFQYVNRLAFSADGKVLFAACSQPEETSIGGIFRSDDRKHEEWKKTCEGEFVDVKCHPTDGQKLIAATVEGRVVYSDKQGARGSWNEIKPAYPWTSRVELAYCRKNPAIVYASVNTNGGEIWRSDDGGKTFVRRASQLANNGPGPRELSYYLGDQGYYANCIWAGDPTNENFVLVGGLNLYRSTDGGDTLADISDWRDDKSAHADHHLIIAAPGFNGTTNKTVYFGNDGGLYQTADVYTVGNDPDRRQGWENLNNGYAVTQFYGAAGNSAGVIVAGTQDNGTARYLPNDKTEPWKFIVGGDGGFCAVDSHDANVLYGEYVFGDVHRNSNQGATQSDFISGEFWDGDHVCWKASPFSIDDAQKRRGLFIAPFALDPNDDNRLLVGCRSLWRTLNAKAPVDSQSGPVWSVVKEPISENDDISAIAIPPGEPDVIWVGYSRGRIFKTTNGLKEIPDWIESRAPGTRRPRRYCHRLTIDPRNHNILYATFGGYHFGNIWKLDGNGHWTPLTEPLPKTPVPVRDLVIHPARSDYLYIATEVGVFASEDSGKTWSPTNEGPTSCRVDQLFWMGQKLVAVTFGRGIFSIDLSKVPPPN